MSDSVFETVEKRSQILKLDFSSIEFARLAEEQELSEEQIAAIEQPRIDTEIQTEPAEAQAEAVRPKISLWKICKYAILAIAIIFGIGRALDLCSNILYIDEMRESGKCAQEVILDNLSTKVAEFPPFEPDFVTQRAEKIEFEGEEYMVRTVTAYVEVENIFGTMMKSNFVVEIGLPVDRTADNYIYTIIEIN